MSDVRTMQDWGNYFRSLSYNGSGDTSIISQAHLQRLATDGPRMFSDDGEIEQWQLNPTGPAIKSSFDVNNLNVSKDLMYFVRQRSSWSPLQTSVRTIQQLLTAHSVSPFFLNALYAFGSKVTGEDDPYFNFCEETVSRAFEQAGRGGYEICYILRTYEKHGRPDLKNPWSLRQALVYQRYNKETRTSVWIFVQLFKSSTTLLWSEVEKGSRTIHPKTLHALLLGSTLPEWRWYLNDQRRSIRPFRDKALYSSLAPCEVDYEVDFIDCQRLEKLIDALSLSKEVLRSVNEIARMLERWVNPRGSTLHAEAERDCCKLISDYIRKTREYMSQAATLQSQAERTSLLLAKLLDFRKIDAANSNTKILTRIGTIAGSQRDHLKNILQKSGLDSRLMKILTFVAMVYSPANLLAAIFSSDLVYIPAGASEKPTGTLHVRKAMWVYVLLSMLLTGITLAATFAYGGWDRLVAYRRVVAGWIAGFI